MNETARIKEAYASRNHIKDRKMYSYFSPSALFNHQQRERATVAALKGNGFDSLSDKLIMDVGCGVGRVLRDFVKYGANPENCYGIDLLSDRIMEAKRTSPNMHFTCGNAEEITFDNNLFDIVLSFTVFTSILDETMKRNIASEMIRVLSPAGIIIWYDYHMDNPYNSSVRGVKKKEIYELFPDCNIELDRIILAPPIVRVLAPYSLLFCYLLENMKILNTHYLGVIRKKD